MVQLASSRSRSRGRSEEELESMGDRSECSFVLSLDARSLRLYYEVEVRKRTSGLTIHEARKLARLPSASKERIQLLHGVGGLNWDLDCWQEITPKPSPQQLEQLEQWVEEESKKQVTALGQSVRPEKTLWSLCKLLLVARRMQVDDCVGCNCLPEYAFQPMGCSCMQKVKRVRMRFMGCDPCDRCCRCTRCDG